MKAAPSIPTSLFLGLALLLGGWTAEVAGADYYIAPDGDDANAGGHASPFRTFAHAIHRLAPGDRLWVRAGTYRLVEEAALGAVETSDIVIEAYPGEHPRILGSRSTAGAAWESIGDGVWRMPVDSLARDPTGMFERDQRLPHATDSRQGWRHAAAGELVEEGHWTKADAQGDGCGEANAGCFVYLRSAQDPGDRQFELAQRGLGLFAGERVTVRGLSVLYAQPQPIFFEGADYVLLENNVFGHTSNGEDNAYAVRIWESQGSIVRGNEVFDSEYWGGTANSKGITFMLTRRGLPNIVERNYIHHIVGSAAVGTKGGVSNLVVRYNRIENVHVAFEVGESRCAWSPGNSDGCQPEDAEYHPAGGWRIYGNTVRNAGVGLSLPAHIVGSDDNWLYNNVFDATETGVEIGWNGSFGNRIGNNVFINNRVAIYLYSGATTTEVTDYLAQFESDHNLIHASTMADIHLRPNWGGDYGSGSGFSLTAFQAAFQRESNSLAADPRFQPDRADYRLAADSPAIASGDAGFWPGRAGVDIGAHPFPHDVWRDGFEDPAQAARTAAP